MTDFEKSRGEVGKRPTEDEYRSAGFTSMGEFVITKVNSYKASVEESDIRDVALMLIAEQPELAKEMREGEGGRKFFSYTLQRLSLVRYVEEAAKNPTKARFSRRIGNLKALVASFSMDVKIEPSWKARLEKEFYEDYFKTLAAFVKSQYESVTVYPSSKALFRAFELTPFEKVKVVILGQDPYHGEGQANGLSFAVNDGVRLPPSLKNIFKELESDMGTPLQNQSGDLSRWAKQGVLLLNATLTVRGSSPGSHQDQGWEQFTDAVIRVLSEERENLVFILWGNYARTKGAHIDRTKHCVIESPHPSPFSAYNGFFGSKPFSKANVYLLEQHGQTPIDWIS